MTVGQLRKRKGTFLTYFLMLYIEPRVVVYSHVTIHTFPALNFGLAKPSPFRLGSNPGAGGGASLAVRRNILYTQTTLYPDYSIPSYVFCIDPYLRFLTLTGQRCVSFVGSDLRALTREGNKHANAGKGM